MALTYDQISAITKKKYIPKLHDNIFDSNPLLQRAKSKGWMETLDGGTSIMAPLNYAKISASGWFAGADTLDISGGDEITAAEYAWKQLYASISITRLDELKNSGDSAVLKLVKEKVRIAEKTMEDKLGTGLYSNATDANSIVGLRQIVATASTVGGISQTTYTWWAAQVDSTSTTLSLPVMQTQFNAATVNNDSPTVGVCTRAIFNIYYGLLQPQQRFQDTETAKGGFTSLMFNGVPILSDSYCPSSHLFFLNEDYLRLWVHKDENMRFVPFEKPLNQNTKTAQIFWAGSLGSTNNRLHAKLSAITG